MGAANSVMNDLLPAMEGFVDFVISDLKDPSGVFREIGSVVMNIVVPAFKILGSAIAIAVTAGDYFVSALTHGLDFVTRMVIGLGNAISDIGSGHFREAGNELRQQFKDGLNDFTKGVSEDVDKADKRLQDFFGKTFFGQDAFKADHKPKGSNAVDTSAAEKNDGIQKRIQSLAAEVVKEDLLANSIKGVVASTLALTAAAEAQQIITDLNIAGATKHIQVSAEQASAIGKLTLMIDAFKEALNVNKALDSSIQKIEESTRAAQLMAGAYLQGADAVAKAKEQIQLMPLEKQVSDLQSVYNQLSTTSGGFDDLKNVLSKMGPAGKELAAQFKALGIENLSTLRTALDDANLKLNTLKQDIPLEVLAKQAEESAKRIGQLTESTQAHIRAMQQENAAILQGGDALKNFNLSVQLQKDFPTEADRQTQAYKDQKAALDDLNQLELQRSVNEQVASQLKFQGLQKNIDYLMTLRQTVQDNSALQLAIDATLHDDKLKQITDYDNLLLKSSNLSDGFKAFFNQFANDGKTAAQQVSDVLNTTFTGIQDNLTKFITGQKTSWAALGKSIEDSLAKTLVTDATKKLTGSVMGIFGLDSSKQLGADQNNPVWVQLATGIGGGIGNLPLPDLSGLVNLGGATAGGGPAGGGGIFGGLGSLLSSVGHSAGGIFGSIGSFISGFLADGGDVQPGRAYVVGERQPELFVPRSAGTIVPNVAMSGDSKAIAVTNHFHISTPDADSFKKSQSQISSAMGMAAQRGLQRNGR